MDAPFNVYKATLRGLKKLGGDDDEELDDVTDEYTKEMKELLSDTEMRMLKVRLDRLITNKLFPLPGSGPR